jgi:hypothetical protein
MNLQELLNKHPKLFGKSNDRTCYHLFGIETGPGWYGLIDDMCTELEALNLNFPIVFNQIKEKYGSLRIYIESGTDEVYAIIDKYEAKSEYVCEQCGDDKTSKIRSTGSDGHGWLYCACDSCYEKIIKRDTEE